MKLALTFAIVLMSCAAHAQDFFVLGETHDNPDHHAEQAKRVADIAPAAIVFEMLTEVQAGAVTADNRSDEAALRAAFDWDNSGWPDFAMYYPIFAAAPEARIYGAGVTRDAARAAMEGGFDWPMGGEVAQYGLDQPLPQDQQEDREARQMAAHCDALPAAMLPGMVNVQRLRDAMLGRAAYKAHQETGGPVVVITGNGHARKDWGMPVALGLVAPELEVFALGQTEDGAELAGDFDEITSAPAPEREDPCAAFRQ